LPTDFPAGVHREQSIRRVYDISDYWLKDFEAEVQAARDKELGKRSFVWPAPIVHFDKTKPFFDEEGRALEGLEQVKLQEINGPMADRALFAAGRVKFFREDYKEADYYFTQITEMHANSPLAPAAVELAIISKHMSTGGSDYDGRKVAEARQLVEKALSSYPELASQKEKREFLDRQIGGITYQQAEKDFKIAEFYRRTKHPGSAYFYYEIVRRRYPGTGFAEKATKRMLELRAKMEQEQATAIKERQAPKETPAQPELAPAPKPVETPPQEPELAPAPKPVANQ
jgi:outer membrane protein assembly factor BamD (BamD/ComL family)